MGYKSSSIAPSSASALNVIGQYNVQQYGATGNALIYTDGAVTAGLTAFTSSQATFTTNDTGKVISITGAGSLSTFNVTGATNASPIVITANGFAAGTNQGSFYTGASMNGIKVTMTGNTNTAINTTCWLKYVSGSGTGPYTFNAYSDSQMTNKVANNGTSGGGGTGFTIGNLVTTITYVSANAVTLALAASSTVNAVRYAYGTDDGVGVQAAVTALIAQTPFNGGTLYFPPGQYLLNTLAVPAATTSYLYNLYSNVSIIGAGKGQSVIIGAAETYNIIQMQAGAGNITDLLVRDLTVCYGGTATQRHGFNNTGIQYIGNANYSIKYSDVRDCEVYNTNLGINFNSNVLESSQRNNYVHNTNADGCSNYGVNTPSNRILISGNFLDTTGDDSVSDNSYSTSTGSNTQVILSNNTIINSGSRGVATVGSNGCTVIGNNVTNSFLSGIACFGGSGFYAINYTTIVDNQVFGAGQGTGGPSAIGQIGSILVESVDGVATASNVLIANNVIGPSAAGNGIGTAIACFSNAAGTHLCNNHQITANRIIGPFNNFPGGNYQLQGNQPSSVPAIFVDNGDDCNIVGNMIQQSYGEAVYVGPNAGGALTVEANIVDTPNTSAAAGTYAFNILGGNAPIVRNNSVRLVGTLAGITNIQPIGPVSQAGNFGVAGSLSGVNTTPGTGYSAIAWNIAGTSVTQGAGNVITFGATSQAYFSIKKVDVHTSVVLSVAPTASGQIYQVVAGASTLSTGYFVDLYNGAISISTTGSLVPTGLATPTNYTAAAGDTIEVMLTDGLLEVWETHSGTRVQINSVYVGRTAVGTQVGFSALVTTTALKTYSLRY